MANNLKQLDANQVLRSAYEVTTNRLRVDASISGSIGSIEVIIDHTNDSIRLGDGTTLFTGTTVSGKTGLDVNIINDSIDVNFEGVDTPTLTNVSMILANTEYSHVIPITTKKLQFRVRGIGKIQYAFSSGGSGTTYYTLSKGNVGIITDLNLSSTITLYFRSDTAGEILEILAWS